jgi:hypothetical protein
MIALSRNGTEFLGIDWRATQSHLAPPESRSICAIRVGRSGRGLPWNGPISVVLGAAAMASSAVVELMTRERASSDPCAVASRQKPVQAASCERHRRGAARRASRLFVTRA